MRVLLGMIEPPLPFGNAAARWFHVLLRGLVARGHDVRAFALCSNPADIPRAREQYPAPEFDLRLYPVPSPEHRGRGPAAKLRTLRKPYAYFFENPDFRADWNAALNPPPGEPPFDVIHLEQLWTAWLASHPEHARRALVNVHHLTAIDLEHAEPASTTEALRNALMFATERKLARNSPNLRACTPRLAEKLALWNPRASIHTLPLALDPALYPWIPPERRVRPENTPPTIALVASMTWYPGRSAAERLLTRLWPAIRDRIPDARLEIVGWGARTALARHLDTPDVAILENVPDVRPHFENADLLLYAPGRGSGMKVKILEAMLYGVPVVTTREGVEGLPAIDMTHAGIADDDQTLVQRAVEILRNKTLAENLRNQARNLVLQHCGPENVLDQLEIIHQSIVNSRKPNPSQARTPKFPTSARP